MEIIKESVQVGAIDGEPLMYEKRVIKYGNRDRNETMLRLEICDGKLFSSAFKFNGGHTVSSGSGCIEELRRFKALLNSFPEL
ncbi:hypothetical protein MYO4S_00277 [Serratia phage 4S]|nr:hypothetical protein MYO4S_00277 [Serratia phage 4S]